MAFRDNLAKLRGLAGEKGYRLERAMMNNRWRLIDDTTEPPAVNQHGLYDGGRDQIPQQPRGSAE